MRIGLFTATYMDMKLEEVCELGAGYGYEAVELPAFSENPHLDLDEVISGSRARELLKMIGDKGLIISAAIFNTAGYFWLRLLDYELRTAKNET